VTVALCLFALHMKFKTTSSFFFLLILYRFFSLPSPTMLSILLLITLYTIVGPTILSFVPLFLFALSCFPCTAFANQRQLTYLPFPFLSLSLSLSVSKSFQPQQNGAPSQIFRLVSQLLPTQFIANFFSSPNLANSTLNLFVW
jgi:hypothetical protein